MNNNIKYIDGRVIELGPSREVRRLTEFDYLKVELETGEDAFLPNCMSKERMTSYLHEAIGENARIFYVDATFSPKLTATTILAIEIEKGKRYSEANSLDDDLAIARKMLSKRKLKFWALLLLTLFFFLLVVTLPLGVISSVPTYYAYRDFRKLQLGISVIPSKLEFEKFYSKNSARNKSQCL